MNNRDLTGEGFSEVITEPQPPPPIGHNMPPPGLAIGPALIDRVKLSHAKLFERGKELIEAEARMPKGPDGKIICPDDVWEKKLTEYVSQLQTAKVSLDTARQAEIEPYRSNMSAVHGLFRDMMDRLVDPDNKTFNSLKVRAEAALTKYKSAKLAAERARIAKEQEDARKAQAEADKRAADKLAEAQRLEAEAARKRNPEKKAEAQQAAAAAQQEAEAAAATAQTVAAQTEAVERENTMPGAAQTRARSANALSGLQEFLDFRNVDRAKIDFEPLRQHLPADAIDQAMRSYMRANGDAVKDEIKNKRQPVRGVEFFMNERTRVTK